MNNLQLYKRSFPMRQQSAST